jgi:eukaryotic-like serine/threonine-protein kinase
MFAQRRWLIWIAVVMVGLGPYVLGILTNVGTADKPLELWRNLWSPERRWFWVAVFVIGVALVWAEFKLSHKSKIPSQEKEADSKKVLSQRVRSQIGWIFQGLLYSRKQLVLNLEECPDLVQPRYRENHTLARTSLPPGKVIERWDAHSRLVLVGQQRAGKSTMLRELARDLIERGDLPVVMQLPAWERYCKKMPTFSTSLFLKWLINELQRYGIKPEISKKWIDESELILLLDGLDEVTDGWRDRCVQSINQFTEDTTAKMVVCSQLEAYEALPRLRFDRAFRIQPLTVEPD